MYIEGQGVCIVGAAKPDAGEPNNVSCWRSAGGEDSVRKPEDSVREHKAEAPCTAGAAKPDSNRNSAGVRPKYQTARTAVW